MSDGARIPREQATASIAPLLNLLRPATANRSLIVAGSYRREKPTVGDLELVCVAADGFLALLDALDAQGVITRGRAWGKKQRQFIYDDLKIDLYTATPDNYGYILWLRTGSADANHRVVAFLKNAANPAPFHLDDGFVWYGTNKLEVTNEATLFQLFGIPFVPPKDREPETYARLFKSARTHQWGDPVPFVKVERVAQDSMFDAGDAAYVGNIGSAPVPVNAADYAQEMRLLRRCPQPEDAGRLRELIIQYERDAESGRPHSYRVYSRKMVEIYSQLLKELDHVNAKGAVPILS